MSEMSVMKALNLAMFEEMAADEKVICIGEDLGKQGGCWGTFTGLQDKFGENRVLDMPIVESAYTLFAVGAALGGYRPIVEYMFADFVTLGFEGIVDIAAKIRFNPGGVNSAQQRLYCLKVAEERAVPIILKVLNPGLQMYQV
jgi:pyruvate dehydrogenase E1 component beta subunit